MTDNVLNYSIVDLRHDLSFHFVFFIFFIWKRIIHDFEEHYCTAYTVFYNIA